MRLVRSERGSVPTVMLAILVMSSLATVLVGTVVTGQKQTRFDQGFEQSLQIAESGLERMVNLIGSKQRSDDFSLPETLVAGGRYSGVADRTGRKWALTATGTAADGTSRTVTVAVSMGSVFGVAAYGRTQLELRGTNSADSYRSGTFNPLGLFSLLGGGSAICRGVLPADPFNPADADTRMCSPTGNGVVATNGDLFLLGGVVAKVDRAEIHHAREKVSSPLANATGFCSGDATTCASSKLRYFREPIEVQPDPVVVPDDLTNQGSFAAATLPAGRQLYTNMTLDSSTVVQGTPQNPTVVYLTGTLTVPNSAVVNFQRIPLGTGPWTPKPSPGLLIFSAGVGPALRFGNNASFAGAVYAPRAAFSGGSVGNIYGSLVTGSISTQGAWNFHYDDALGDVQTEARFVTGGWAER